MELEELLSILTQFPDSEKKKELISKAEGLAAKTNYFKEKYAGRTDEEAVKESRNLEKEIDLFMQKGYELFRTTEIKLKEQIRTPESDDETVNKILAVYSSNPATDYSAFDAAVKKNKIEYTLSDIQNLVKKTPIIDDRRTFYLYISAIINNIIKPEDTIVLEIKDKTKGVGCHLPHGTLILEGETEKSEDIGIYMSGGIIEIKTKAGLFLGREMTGGKIITHSTDSYAGTKMSAGIIKIKTNAGYSLGAEMCGGKITANSTDYLAGISMKGGEIIIKTKAGDGAGTLMSGGKIILNSDAGDKLGNAMTGGKITVYGKAGKNVGIGRKGGLIELLGKYESIGKPAEGSTAIIKIK